MLKKLRYSFLLFCLIAYFNANCVAASLSAKINSIISAKGLRSVDFGIVIAEADSGKVIYSRNSKKPLTPASNMKLLTSAAALKYLSSDYKFETSVALAGDKLVIIGSGDPLFGVNFEKSEPDDSIFDKISDALKNADVNEVNGIIVDSTIFDDNRAHPNWPVGQLNRSYACEVSGLNFNANCLKIRARKAGKSVTLTTVPKTSYVKLVNKVKPSGKGGIGSYRSTVPNNITVYGRCSKAESFNVAIERPAAFFGIYLAEKLAASGITVSGQLSEQKAAHLNLEPLLTFETPITDVMKRCNTDSFGLAAESLLKTIGAKMIMGGADGSWKSGAMAATNYLNSLGISPDEYVIDDGSGLSAENKLSANLLSKTILDIYKSGDWLFFRNTLAIGGADGTIRRYFRTSKYKGKVFAKTGYIKGVRSLSGVCIKDSKTYVFSILANKANGKTKVAIHNIVKAVMDN